MDNIIFTNLQRPLGSGEGQTSPADWVNLVIQYAAEKNASDIHFDVGFGKFIVRVRVDGALQLVSEQPDQFYEMVVSRIKIMSVLNTNERHLPQEGHAVLKRNNGTDQNTIDLRVSVFPTVHGESMVIRILNRKEFIFDKFEDMGMVPADADLFRDMIRKPNGMILVTGPSGSGKSAIIYTALQHIQTKEKNIVTLEDPVEYQMEYVRQSQINTATGYTFAKGMSSVLRQDSDVIVIGEIRDDETADIAVRAALSGRLVFSTLHTNNTIDAIMRFLEFGVPRSFVASALRLVVARRLMRTLCKDCVEPYRPEDKVLQDAGAIDPNAQFYHGKGCSTCSDTGFKGRTGIYEFFIVDKDIQDLIVSNATFSTILATAQQKGLRLLRQSAIDLALSGQTTLEEALYITG